MFAAQVRGQLEEREEAVSQGERVLGGRGAEERTAEGQVRGRNTGSYTRVRHTQVDYSL